MEQLNRETLMKEQLEKIKLEYDLFEAKDSDKGYEIYNVFDFVLGCYDEMDDKKSDLTKEKSKNITCKKISNFLGSFSEKIGYKEAEFYDTANQFVDQQLDIVSRYEKHLTDFLIFLDKDNCFDIYRLAQFTQLKYLANMQRISDKRRSFPSYGNGQGTGILKRKFVAPDHEAFNQFFKLALDAVTSVEKVEKVKK